jgi:hypothetical protein
LIRRTENIWAIIKLHGDKGYTGISGSTGIHTEEGNFVSAVFIIHWVEADRVSHNGN